MHIKMKTLKNVCDMPIKAFRGLGNVTETRDGIYIYKDNDASILAVAHLDTVLGSKHFYSVDINGDQVIINPCLDDRLGVYTLLYLLPQFGIKYDLLLTEGEETGLSTAQYFETSKQYNWMFSFDRHGDDVVMYQYEDDNIVRDLKQAGLKPSQGSFSDIADLERLGIKGINIGTGYYGEHSYMSYANLTVLKSQVRKFKIFYDMFKNKHMPHEDTGYIKYISRGFYGGREWQDYNKQFLPTKTTKQPVEIVPCDLCGQKTGANEIDGLLLCNTCFSQVGKCAVCQTIQYDDEMIDGICQNCL